MSQQMFSIVIAAMIIIGVIGGISQGKRNIELTRQGVLPAAEKAKDNFIFFYMD
jgi:hypothetical protein